MTLTSLPAENFEEPVKTARLGDEMQRLQTRCRNGRAPDFAGTEVKRQGVLRRDGQDHVGDA